MLAKQRDERIPIALLATQNDAFVNVHRV